MLIELEDKIANLLKKLRNQAAVRQISFDAYLESFAEAGAVTPNNEKYSLEDMDRLLDDLSAGLLDIPPLPHDFHRADIYSDHN